MHLCSRKQFNKFPSISKGFQDFHHAILKFFNIFKFITIFSTLKFLKFHFSISEICGKFNKFEFISCAMSTYYAHQAARQGNLKLLKYLSKKGVNLNEKDNNKNTPILLAALNGHYSIVRYLYHSGAGYQAIPNRDELFPYLRVL